MKVYFTVQLGGGQALRIGADVHIGTTPPGGPDPHQVEIDDLEPCDDLHEYLADLALDEARRITRGGER